MGICTSWWEPYTRWWADFSHCFLDYGFYGVIWKWRGSALCNGERLGRQKRSQSYYCISCILVPRFHRRCTDAGSGRQGTAGIFLWLYFHGTAVCGTVDFPGSGGCETFDFLLYATKGDYRGAVDHIAAATGIWCYGCISGRTNFQCHRRNSVLYDYVENGI